MGRSCTGQDGDLWDRRKGGGDCRPWERGLAPRCQHNGCRSSGHTCSASCWIISHCFSRDLVLLALVSGSRYTWDRLGYCLDCAPSNRPFTLHRLTEGAVRAIIIGNAATEAARSEWRRNLCSGQLLYFESGFRCMQCQSDKSWDDPP